VKKNDSSAFLPEKALAKFLPEKALAKGRRLHTTIAVEIAALK